MRIIRLLYPDFAGGGLETYYLGTHLLAKLLPENTTQKVYVVDIDPPSKEAYKITEGVYAKEAVMAGIKRAGEILREVQPDKVITLGGNCLVSQAPFDYLHGKYKNLGIIWIDAHPDVSTVNGNYPYAHAFVLGSLLGEKDTKLSHLRQYPKFLAHEILYVGLQSLLPDQESFLRQRGVNFKIQDKEFLSDQEISNFCTQFEHIVIHLDIDVLDASLFFSTYFANKELVGDGSLGGRMSMNQLRQILRVIFKEADVVGLTLAEYLPFDAHKLQDMLAEIDLLREQSV
ncbi:arginase family protein [Helicobacter suis]|uniref:arginase family protein n=1 Tax=Helicobacter suis TaxID=104628 RepID=UPI0013D37A98|nr:arginase family protein [Helicobacter suis]